MLSHEHDCVRHMCAVYFMHTRNRASNVSSVGFGRPLDVRCWRRVTRSKRADLLLLLGECVDFRLSHIESERHRHNVDDRLGGHEQSHQRLPWIRYCRKNVCCLCSNSIGLTRGGQVRRWRRQMSATTTDSIIGTTLRCSRCLASSRRTVPLDGR